MIILPNGQIRLFILKMELLFSEIKEFLQEKYHKYNHPSFIETDPIQVPKLFSRKEDIEIAEFLTSTIA